MDWEKIKNLDLSDLQLDVNDIGNWPMAARAIAIMMICAGLLFAGYWFDSKDQLTSLEKAAKKETDLKQTFERKHAQASNLEAYKAQLETIKQSFGTLLRQLPDKTEVADLLVDVSQSGLATGLEFNLFQPGNEIQREFYAELPIQISVTGNYHQFGAFVSALAALPRIVTLHDVKISSTQTRGQNSPTTDTLTMSATAKTYRYLDESAGK